MPLSTKTRKRTHIDYLKEHHLGPCLTYSQGHTSSTNKKEVGFSPPHGKVKDNNKAYRLWSKTRKRLIQEHHLGPAVHCTLTIFQGTTICHPRVCRMSSLLRKSPISSNNWMFLNESSKQHLNGPKWIIQAASEWFWMSHDPCCFLNVSKSTSLVDLIQMQSLQTFLVMKQVIHRIATCWLLGVDLYASQLEIIGIQCCPGYGMCLNPSNVPFDNKWWHCWKTGCQCNQRDCILYTNYEYGIIYELRNDNGSSAQCPTPRYH